MISEFNEAIVFVVRETGWSLEYIRNLPILELYALVDELSYQKAIDEYRQQCCFAALKVTLINLWSKSRVSVSELVGEVPKRKEHRMVGKILAEGTKPQKLTLADGQEYELAPMTLNILIQVEDKFDKSYFDLVNSRRMNHIRHIVYLRLKGKYPELTEEKVGELVTVAVLTEIAKLYGVE